MRMTKLGGALLGAAVGVLAAITTAPAQDAAATYPNKPIRVIVPFAAGGGNDIFARLVGQKLSDILGQPVINENKPGAGGRIAAEYVMNQPHDGYTLFIGASGVMSIAAAAYPNLTYHPTKTFIPLSMIANFPLIMFTRTVRSCRLLTSAARAMTRMRPSSISFRPIGIVDQAASI